MRRLLHLFSILCAIAISSYFIFFYTTTGSKFVLKWLSPFLPFPFEYQSFNGNLHDGVQLNDVILYFEEKKISLQQVTIKAKLNFSYNPLHWQVLADTGKQNLQVINPDLAGEIDAQIESEGKTSFALNQAVVVTIKKLTGNVYEQPLTGYGTLQLAQDETVDIKHLHLQTGENYIDLDGRLTDQWQLDWDLHLSDLAQLDKELTGRIIGKGILSGPKLQPRVNGQLQIADLLAGELKIKQLQLTSKLSLDDLEINLNGQDITYNGVTLNKITAASTLTAKRQMISAHCELPEEEFKFKLQGGLHKNNWRGVMDLTSIKPTKLSSQVKISAKLSPKHGLSNWQTYPLDIKVTGGLESIAFLNPLLTGVSHLDGQLNYDWKITGTPNDPKYHGSATVENGQLKFDKTGTKLSNIYLTLQGTSFNRIQYQGSANAGSGKLKLSGATDFSQVKPATQFTLTGQNALLVDTDVAKASMDPNLQVTLHGNKINITGTVLIPDAMITPADYSSSVTLSDDVVFVSEQDKAAPSPWHFTSKIELRLGNKVLLNFMGLKALLGGSLVLQDGSTKATTASGQLYVKRGRFDAYGQSLTIQEGQLLFAGGPVTNPGLSIRAVKKVGAVQTSGNESSGGARYVSSDTTVGLKLVGTLNKPNLSLFSIPRGLTQAQILSQLVLGKPLSEISDDKDKLLDALKDTDTKPTESKMLLAQLKHSLGLDELGVQTGDLEHSKQSAIKNTSLTLGKLLSPKLLISYSVGLTESVNIFSATYRINNKWMLRSQTDLDSSSVDLLYSIETN